MKSISFELFILGNFINEETYEREQMSLGVYDRADIPQLLERIDKLIDCDLDFKLEVESLCED